MYALIRYWEPGPPLHSQASYQCPEHTLGRPGLLLKVRALAQRTDTFCFDSLLLPSPCLGRPVPSAHDLSLAAISPSRPRQEFGISIERTWAPNEPGIAGRLSLRPLRVMNPQQHVTPVPEAFRRSRFRRCIQIALPHILKVRTTLAQAHHSFE